MYVSVSHSNGINAYSDAGIDFRSLADAVHYLKHSGFCEDEEVDYCGTVYIFDDETLEAEPD